VANEQTLPDDVDALKALVRAQRLELERLKIQLARLRRTQFGRSSEQLAAEIRQLELALDALSGEASVTPVSATVTPLSSRVPRKPARRPLPAHLPRETLVHATACRCPACGGELRKLGEDVAEILEYVPARFKVIRHVRPKMSCRACSTVVQTPAPSRPLVRSFAGAGLLAHVLVSKYADHLPLYRQAQIYAREGVALERSTLADWVGGASALLAPLVEALGAYVMRAEKLHADDTPVPVLSPGAGRTKTGRLWTYVRDDRPAGDDAPPAVWFRYSADRKGEHPARHLRAFHGVLQVDGYAGFDRLFNDDNPDHPRREAACWAHVRRKFYDLQVATGSPIAAEALRQIAALYQLEDSVRGQAPPLRQAVRQARVSPLLDTLHRWLHETLASVAQRSALAGAIRYALTRWRALTRYCDDGRIEIDNNAAERALRGVALGRKNYLFAGADCGGERAATFYSLIETAKLNGLDPQAYLRYVLMHLPEHPSNRVAELLPWHVAVHLVEPLVQAAA